MLLSLVHLLLYSFVYAAPRPTVHKRESSGPLWDINPVCSDLRQTSIGNCWFDASMCVLAKSNPEDLISKVKYSGDVTKVSSANFTVCDNSSNPHSEVVSFSDATFSGDGESSGKKAWWPAGFQRAALQMGIASSYNGQAPGEDASGKWLGSSGATGLMILTGISAVDELPDAADAFIMLRKSDWTPIIFETVPKNTKKLVANHAYAVMTTRVDGSKN
ncbi:hypothetical protein P7C73_g1573, partial [Tremellales sp. Uapishka_1]